MGSLARSDADQSLVKVNEDEVRGHLDEVVRQTVEETLNSMLDAMLDAKRSAGRRVPVRGVGRHLAQAFLGW